MDKHNRMEKLLGYILAAVVGLSLLASAAPLLVKLIHAALPLVVVVGVVVIAVRLAFFHTRRW